MIQFNRPRSIAALCAPLLLAIALNTAAAPDKTVSPKPSASLAPGGFFRPEEGCDSVIFLLPGCFKVSRGTLPRDTMPHFSVEKFHLTSRS